MCSPSPSPTKAFIKNLLKDSLHYPACDLDGGVIKFCNEHYGVLGINSYVYADYGIEENQVFFSSLKLQTFSFYLSGHTFWDTISGRPYSRS